MRDEGQGVVLVVEEADRGHVAIETAQTTHSVLKQKLSPLLCLGPEVNKEYL